MFLDTPTLLPAQAPQPQVEIVRQLNYERKDGRVALRRIAGKTALFFQTKMSCDVDGSPNAYHPLDDNLSLDVIDSAGGKRRNGLPNGPLDVLPSPDVVVYWQGQPYVQPDGDYKGFYLSSTSYENPALPAIDPTRYLDARNIHYIVLPGGYVPEAQIGDLAAVYDPYSRHVSYAVFGDVGPGDESGEASLGTIKGLDLLCTDGKSSPGQCRDDLTFIVFPNTRQKLEAAEAWPHSQATIDRLAAAELTAWGGVEQLAKVTTVGSVPDTPENAPVYDLLARLMTNHLVDGDSDISLPPRYHLATGRLPCRPEIAVTLNQAVRHLEAKIADAELHHSEVTPEVPALLQSISVQIAKFPEADYAENIDLVRERAAIQALIARANGANITYLVQSMLTE
jgi:hypothetical protein